jgi:hypothetical protein
MPSDIPLYSEIIDYFNQKNIIIFPVCLNAYGKEKLEEKLTELNKKNKLNEINNKIIIFILDDYEFELKSYEDQIIIRSSADKSLLKNNEFILPYLWTNIKKPFEPLKRTAKPIIGFCGWRSKPRYEILKKIRNHNELEANYILRNKFMGGHRLNEDIVNEFYENIKQSHFIICNRGTGNFSMRFYQTLASGRIPLVVDTDMQLPLNNIAPYHEVIIMEKTVEKVIKKLLFIWETKDIEKMQQECYKFYEKYLSYNNYAPWLYQEIKNKGSI